MQFSQCSRVLAVSACDVFDDFIVALFNDRIFFLQSKLNYADVYRVINCASKNRLFLKMTVTPGPLYQ